MNIGVFGGGAWGTALACLCAKGDNNVVHWSYNGIFNKLLDVPKPKKVVQSGNIKDLKNCEYWLIAIPAAFFRETSHKMRDIYNNQPILICTKGMENETWQFMSEILETEIPECHDFGVLSGPQFANEVAEGVPTGSTLAGNERVRAGGHTALSSLYLQDTNDIIGTQICGCAKNAVSLISGYLTIKSNSENERALLFTRAWNEIVELGIKMGANYETFLGFCGLGDLFLSATSLTSRNFSAGQAIAQNKECIGTIEGIFALRGLIKRAEKLHVKTPILTEMKEKMGL